MKKQILKFKKAVLFSAALIIGLTSCNDSQDEMVTLEGGALKAVSAYDAVITLPKIISDDYTCTANNLYLLNGKTYVKSGATLNIEAGTRIEGVYEQDPEYASALVICRGAKIMAEGTESTPIVFTAHTEKPKVGDWGGLIILGNAPTCRSQYEPANRTIEGISLPTVPKGVDITYGGNEEKDNSGVLRYVRVEYAGVSIGDRNEINSFTFGGVGSGTIVEYCQAYYGADDSFEFFGGTVNAKYLISVAAYDDAFDFDYGYQGNLQFLLAVLDDDASYSEGANGIECDHESKNPTSTPKTRPVISNLTVVGTPNGETSLYNPENKGINNVLYGARFRENTRFVLRNSVFYGYKNVIYVDDKHGNITNIVRGDVIFTNDITKSVFANNVIGTIPEANHKKGDWTPGSSNSLVVATTIGMGIRSCFSYDQFFGGTTLAAFRNPARTGADSTNLGGFFTPTTYIGAVSPNSKEAWIDAAWVNKSFPIY